MSGLRRKVRREVLPERPRTLMGQFLRASMLRDKEERERVSQRFPEFSTLSSLHVMIAAFDVAIRRRFSPDADLVEISTFIADIRRTFGQAVPSLEVEALMRHLLGDDVKIDDIPPNTRTQAMIFVLMAIADHLDRDIGEVDAVLSVAEKRVFARGLEPELA